MTNMMRARYHDIFDRLHNENVDKTTINLIIGFIRDFGIETYNRAADETAAIYKR